MLLLVRHGQTAPNVDGVLLGRADPPLTELGRIQAEALADVLPRPARIVSSPLQRARQTAAAIGGEVAVEIDDRWTELDYGELDGQPPSAVAADVWARWQASASFTPSGGESLAHLDERVRSACDSLAADAEAGVVVVVSHVSPIKAALAWALGAPVTVSWRMYVEDASVSRIDVTDNGPMVRWFNRGLVPLG